MPDFCHNLRSLSFDTKPKNIRFLAKFKNLMSLKFKVKLEIEHSLFLMRACPSLRSIILYNELTDFLSVLSCANRVHAYEIVHYHHSEISIDSRLVRFASLEKMLLHYYENDIFNEPKFVIGDFKVRKSEYWSTIPVYWSFGQPSARN